MPKTQTADAVFTKPTTKKNSGQLLWWVFSKPSLLDQYSNTLSRKQALREPLQLSVYSQDDIV